MQDSHDKTQLAARLTKFNQFIYSQVSFQKAMERSYYENLFTQSFVDIKNLQSQIGVAYIICAHVNSYVCDQILGN